MDRFSLLNSDTSGDDQVLETDIMRFLAIIGIVFWIIFSVIKSIPFQAETTISSAAVQTQAQKPDAGEAFRLPDKTEKPEPKAKKTAKPKPETEQMPEEIQGPASEPKKAAEPAPEHQKAANKPSDTKIKPKPAPETVSPDKAQPKAKPEVEPADKQVKEKTEKPDKAEKKPEKKAKTSAKVVKGINLEFQSLDAIMELVQQNRLRVYGRAKATGFDLIFLGVPAGNTVRFKSAEEIPREMWEIKDGETRQYFINLMAETFPSIRTFPEKSVQVAFLDEALEGQVLQKMDQLRQNEKNGVLSVTGDGALVFNEMQSESPKRKTEAP